MRGRGVPPEDHREAPIKLFTPRSQPKRYLASHTAESVALTLAEVADESGVWQQHACCCVAIGLAFLHADAQQTLTSVASAFSKVCMH